jgi:phosphoenolpyruvate synthase/pyruvate phosphate dikinase
MSPYRDWVIQAFNKNMPYDQFVIEQLAGDLLPDASIDQKLATAFHRNTMTNTEGGTDREEFRTAAVKDRVDTTGQVFLGAVKMRQPELTGDFAILMGWADAVRRLKVRANADT